VCVYRGRKDRERVVGGTTHFLLLLFYSTFYFYYFLSKWGEETMVVPPFDSFVSHLVVTVTKEGGAYSLEKNE
jgi:hypothetical protein